ncbi:unnamed protein product [Closterium sp. Naga37s-1]|nr:unnamed protein product [Closterium sp. Naga37s-1]
MGLPGSPFIIVLLCAALFTAAASASFLGPFFPRGDGSSVPLASQAVKPQIWKGNVFEKYVAKLRPTKINGKVVGDKGASGIFVLKGVSYGGPVNAFYEVYALYRNLKSGGGNHQIVGHEKNLMALCGKLKKTV